MLINSRSDFQAPRAWAWELHRARAAAQLAVVDGAGHDATAAGITSAIVDGTNRFAG